MTAIVSVKDAVKTCSLGKVEVGVARGHHGGPRSEFRFGFDRAPALLDLGVALRVSL